MMRAKLSLLLKKLNLWGIYAYVYGAWIRKRTKQPWVLGRVACLGLDTYQLLHTQLPICNIQKGRVDYLNRVNKREPGAKARATKIVKYIERDDIKGLIIQEEFSEFSFKRTPEMVYMDSYSELTDQLFVSRKNDTSFCCNYSDLLSSYKEGFTAEGLLPVDDLLGHYRQFFTMLRKRFSAVPIVFIHFPCKLDTRQEFITRHHKIKEAIQVIHTEFPPFHVYEVPDELVEHAENDKFPYHYNDRSYQYLQNVINKNHFNR